MRDSSSADAPLSSRILEPELMDEPAQVRAYAEADFAEVNQGFTDRLLRSFPELEKAEVVDLGCGPADIPRRIALARRAVRIVAVDGARAMLRYGRGTLGAAGLVDRVALVAARVPDLPFRGRRFDAVISNSLLHHLPDPGVAWREIRRIGRAGAAVFVMDLFRPRTRREARSIVEAGAGAEPAVLRRDFYHSLLAAFTVDEVREQLHRAGLGGFSCEIVSERHWLVCGRLR